MQNKCPYCGKLWQLSPDGELWQSKTGIAKTVEFNRRSMSLLVSVCDCECHPPINIAAAVASGDEFHYRPDNRPL